MSSTRNVMDWILNIIFLGAIAFIAISFAFSTISGGVQIVSIIIFIIIAIIYYINAFTGSNFYFISHIVTIPQMNQIMDAMFRTPPRITMFQECYHVGTVTTYDPYGGGLYGGHRGGGGHGGGHGFGGHHGGGFHHGGGIFGHHGGGGLFGHHGGRMHHGGGLFGFGHHHHYYGPYYGYRMRGYGWRSYASSYNEVVTTHVARQDLAYRSWRDTSGQFNLANREIPNRDSLAFVKLNIGSEIVFANDGTENAFLTIQSAFQQANKVDTYQQPALEKSVAGAQGRYMVQLKESQGCCGGYGGYLIFSIFGLQAPYRSYVDHISTEQTFIVQKTVSLINDLQAPPVANQYAAQNPAMIWGEQRQEFQAAGGYIAQPVPEDQNFPPLQPQAQNGAQAIAGAQPNSTAMPQQYQYNANPNNGVPAYQTNQPYNPAPAQAYPQQYPVGVPQNQNQYQAREIYIPQNPPQM